MQQLAMTPYMFGNQIMIQREVWVSSWYVSNESTETKWNRQATMVKSEITQSPLEMRTDTERKDLPC